MGTNLSNLILCLMNFHPLARQWVLTKPDTLLGTKEMEINQLSSLFLGIHNLMGETNINKFVFSEKEMEGQTFKNVKMSTYRGNPISWSGLFNLCMLDIRIFF